jgi:hypothetical protein
MMALEAAFGLLLLSGLSCSVVAQSDSAAGQQTSSSQLQELEEKLNLALKQLNETKAQVESLTAEVRSLRGESPSAPSSAVVEAAAAVPVPPVPGSPQKGDVPAATTAPPPESPQAAFIERIVDPGLSDDERENKITAKPELFVQARYSTLPFDKVTVADFPSNFRISRAEMHWSGRINDKLGAGFEIQYHPANDGDPTQLINDAFLQYYLGSLTFTGGQFVVPFGFDNQQSSAERESPERGMFVGYFFPGHRDRGVLLQGNLNSWNMPDFQNVDFFAGVFNGNRFWADNNRQLNYDFRLRKRFQSVHLALGVSGQVGHQLLPPGVTGTDAQNVIGVDAQYAIGRLGLRAEMVAGNMPSTLLSLTPVFAPFFRPGRNAAAGTAFAGYQLSPKGTIYVRYDQFNRDLVNGFNIRAVNFGYLRYLPANTRVGIDFQEKNHPSFNDDAVNSRLQVTWGIVF